MSVIIRKETPNDIDAIHNVTIAAFLHEPHTDHTEHFVVKALRSSGNLSISLVAEQGGSIVGHVAASPVIISDGSHAWYGLGPISVDPSQQGKGIGSQLMDSVILELKKMGANGCVLLGDPNYYGRFGFKPMEGLILPDAPVEYFQALLLDGDLPQGNVAYHESFNVAG